MLRHNSNVLLDLKVFQSNQSLLRCRERPATVRPWGTIRGPALDSIAACAADTPARPHRSRHPSKALMETEEL